MTREMIARIATQFHLPAERTEVQSDWHYQSTTPMIPRAPGLSTRKPDLIVSTDPRFDPAAASRGGMSSDPYSGDVKYLRGTRAPAPNVSCIRFFPYQILPNPASLSAPGQPNADRSRGHAAPSRSAPTVEVFVHAWPGCPAVFGLQSKPPGTSPGL